MRKSARFSVVWPRQIAAITIGVLSCLLFCRITQAQGSAPYLWIEGEATGTINVKPNIAGWGHTEFLSDGKWLQISIDADKVEKEIPTGGAVLTYPFRIVQAGDYEVWNRIGYEFVRSPFEWRVDASVWNTVTPDALTTDLMELADWTEVAWIKLGASALQPGVHRLEIRLPVTKDDKGKTARILYASDALCLSLGAFHPNSKFKPGSDYRTPMDREAAQKVFEMPALSAAAERVDLPLNGVWEICRNDEQTPGEVAAPIADFPQNPYWYGIPVPGDKMAHPEWVMAHRVWYRTHVRIPVGAAGRSFHLVFPQNNLNTTVYVNGVYCGFNKNPFARFSVDVTQGVKPGLNEVWVGIKDAYYGYSANPDDPMKLRKHFNLPLSFTHTGFQDLAYPVWNAFQSGMLVTPELVSAGSVYSADVFCKPSVARKELVIDVTLSNPKQQSAVGEVVCAAINAVTGQVEKTLSAKPFTLAAGANQVLSVSGSWDNPILWWPDDPHLYRLRTTIKVDGKPVDISETPFGFREWTIDGIHFKLNGVTFHGYHDAHGDGTKEEWLAFHRKTHQAMMRFWGTEWKGLPPEDALRFFDTNGVVVRRQGMLDGEAIGYNAIETDPVLKKKNGSEIKMDLMQNWRDQIVAQVQGERNHPSVMLWSIENEWLYINCINLYGGLMGAFEAEVARTSEAVQKADPTRPTMTDGGGANKNQTMPVHGNHYVASAFMQYPALAYSANPDGGGRGRWTWDEKRPRFIGEDYFIAGNHPELSYFGGEAVFTGKTGSLPAASLMARILNEGYRWADFGAWDLYMQPSDGDNSQYNALSPRAVLCREWDSTFGSGQKVNRSLALFNDTHYADPMELTWTLTVGGKKIREVTTTHHVLPGENKKFDVILTMPAVPARQEGQWTLRLTVAGKEVYRDVKSVSVLPIGPITERPASRGALPVQSLAVFDPRGTVMAFLRSRSIPFTSLASLAVLPEASKVLLIGKDALTPAESASSHLAAYAAAGRTVIVLEQQNPLRFQGLPGEAETATNEGRTAFAEDLGHPALQGLQQKDFFTWGDDEVVYRNAYVKPTRGGKSLIECDNLLQNSALIEMPADKGLLLLSQLVLEEKLPTNAVAQQILFNLLAYGASYHLTYRPVTFAPSADIPQSGLLQKALDGAGLTYTKAADPLQAISGPGGKVAVIAATSANLKTLANSLPKVDAFTRAGGWIVLNGLTPEGLADYNRLVGYDHMIRPFRRERVTFSPSRNPLTAGIPTGDIVMYSPKRIFDYQDGNYVVSDEFSYVVDYDEVAPFAHFNNTFYENIVNGFVSADGWPLIVDTDVPANGGPLEIVMDFPKPQTVTELTYIGNTMYYPTTKINLLFDEKKENGVTFATRPDNQPQTFALPAAHTGKRIDLQLAEWKTLPNVRPVIGLDNIYLKAQRDPAFYRNVKPMLNVGGMMEYPRGQGGIVLCNLLFKETEEVPENAVKKRNILAALLRNLKAPFSSKSVIAGESLNYRPIDLAKQADQYRDERGWFGDKNFTFKDLPTGKHIFAGVPYTVYDFPTSPVPNAVMLGGNGVPNSLPQEVRGIPVNQKADALFFLQTARIDQRRNRDEIKQNRKFEMARYVVHYADGQMAIIPLYSELDVDDYRQKTAAPLPGAQIAWTHKYEGTEFEAVAYSKQWNNPRPNVAIQSIDLVYGPDRRGVPVLLALTAATSH
ncbi:MAG: Beta-galactosidase/beta-glucuronidase [Chthonomonadaceae bacterium]|nr:Beta-galactosidase/beta-glucuronidase [Chthonomonadaceae bacterium]